MTVYKILHIDRGWGEQLGKDVKAEYHAIREYEVWSSLEEALSELAETGWEVDIPVYGPFPLRATSETTCGNWMEALILVNRSADISREVQRQIRRTERLLEEWRATEALDVMVAVMKPKEEERLSTILDKLRRLLATTDNEEEFTEVERKFRLSGLPPPAILGEGVEISQGYLVTDPGELRSRSIDGRLYLTVKGDGTISRKESEIQIPAHVFEALWPHTERTRVVKTRYSVHHEGFLLEVDEYRGHLAGLITLECEFRSEKAAATLRLPEWARDAVEVTEARSYKNKNLAIHGLPVDS